MAANKGPEDATLIALTMAEAMALKRRRSIMLM